jgi:hypothetical protein
MKNLILLAVALCLNLASVSQINHSYTFALGNTDGVTLSWDAFGDNLEILGCYLYKRVKYNQPEELISPEMIVSGDSTFSFTDTGVFDPVYPPIYSIHCVTADSVYITNEIYAFQSIEIEFISDIALYFEIHAWNGIQCCRNAIIFYCDLFLGVLPCNGPVIFLHQHLEGWTQPCGYFFIIEDNDWWINYSKLIIYSPYIEKLLLTSVNPELSQMQQKLKVSPNPASSYILVAFDTGSSGMADNSLLITDMAGRLVKTVNLGNQTIGKQLIGLEGMPKGVYVISLVSYNGFVANSKLIIQ